MNPNTSEAERLRAEALELRELLAEALGPLPVDRPHMLAAVRSRLEKLREKAHE